MREFMTGSRDSFWTICSKDPLALSIAFQCKPGLRNSLVLERRRQPFFFLMNNEEDRDLYVDLWGFIWPLGGLL